MSWMPWLDKTWSEAELCACEGRAVCGMQMLSLDGGSMLFRQGSSGD